MILSTVPGMVMLGCSGIRAVSRFLFRYFRGSGHARAPHFLRDAGTYRVAGFFLSFTHGPIVAPR